MRAADVRAPAQAGRAWLWVTVALTAGAFAVAVVLAPPASAAPDRGLGWMLFLGSSVHVASTGWFYTLDDIRSYAAGRPWRFRRVPIALVLAGAATAALLTPSVVSWLLLPFFGWQFFHFQKQNLGIAALAASSGGTPTLRPAERRALGACGGAGICALLAHPALLQLRVDPRLELLFPLSAVAFGLAVCAGLALLARRPPGDRPAGFCVAYLVALLFSLPVFVFASPYAAVGGMTIAHGLQYLLLVGLVAAGDPRATSRMFRLAALGNIAVAGGAVLEATSHLHGAAPVGRLLFGAYLGAVTAHFVIDAGLWRLSDPFPRAFLAERVPYLVPAGLIPGGRDPDGPGLAARTQTTGGLRESVSVARWVKPASCSWLSIPAAARRDVVAVAPGQRGWDAMAMRPPGTSRRRSSASRSAGADQNPRELTARIVSNGPSRAGGR
jgi:hypothetical protein